MDKAKSKEDKSKRRKTTQACIYCRRSHMTCDEGRPCKRCIKRDIAHLCHDESTSKTHPPRDSSPQSSKRASTSSTNVKSHDLQEAKIIDATKDTISSNGATSSKETLPVTTNQNKSSNGAMPLLKLSASPGLPSNIEPSSQGNLGNLNLNWGTSALGGAGFLGLGGAGYMGLDGDVSGSSDAAGGNEFNILSEFLESLDGSGVPTPGINGSSFANPGGPSNFENSLSLLSRPPINATSLNANGVEGAILSPAIAPAAPSDNAAATTPTTTANNASAAGAGAATWPPSTGIQIPGLSAESSNKTSRRPSFNELTLSGSGANIGNLSSKTERFLHTAADQKDGTRDERLGRVIQAKYDAGLLKPYNHVNGYARLNRWMEQNASQRSRRRILKPLSIFRPAFRAVAQSLTTVDLIYIEEAFERLLLDYDRVFSTQGIPACLWRRTGEIYKGNKEFADLVGVGIEALRDGRCTIYELMQEESAVNYWEKYGAVSFDPGQKAVLTSCVLKTKSKSVMGPDKGNDKEETYIPCCFSFTIRRDAWSIPCLIVGNFLPLQQAASTNSTS